VKRVSIFLMIVTLIVEIRSCAPAAQCGEVIGSAGGEVVGSGGAMVTIPAGALKENHLIVNGILTKSMCYRGGDKLRP